MNNLQMVIMSVLVDKPSTGYDIKKQTSEFWPCEHQGIYREMRRLSEKGYIESETINYREGMPNKRVYRATEKGISIAIEESGKKINPPKFLNNQLNAQMAMGMALSDSGHSDLTRLKSSISKYIDFVGELSEKYLDQDLNHFSGYVEEMIESEKTAGMGILNYVESEQVKRN